MLKEIDDFLGRYPHIIDTPEAVGTGRRPRARAYWLPNSTQNANPYDPNSVANPYGQYGSQYSPNSINNPYGAGSPYRYNSPNNPYGVGMGVYR